MRSLRRWRIWATITFAHLRGGFPHHTAGRGPCPQLSAAMTSGWDHAPGTSNFGVISPLTCPSCEPVDTVWWCCVRIPTLTDISALCSTASLVSRNRFW